MQFIVNAVAFVVAFFTKKLAMKYITLPIKILIYSFVIGALTTYILAFITFFNFIFKLVKIFSDFIHNFNTTGFSSSSSSLIQYWNVFISFLNASGLADAFTTAANLFLYLLFGYISIKLTIKFATVVKEVSKTIADMSYLLGD